MKQVFTTYSAKETEALAGRLLSQLLKSRIVLLSGHLGSGKTTFVKGIAKALGIKERIKSPTYVYVNRYVVIPLCVIPSESSSRGIPFLKTPPSDSSMRPTKKQTPLSRNDTSLFHIDLYRLPKNSDPAVLAELGLEDLLGTPNTMTCIEWPERIQPMFLKGVRIQFTKRENAHEITVDF